MALFKSYRIGAKILYRVILWAEWIFVCQDRISCWINVDSVLDEVNVIG